MKAKHIDMYMRIAHALAEASPGIRLKVGAVLVKGNNIISTGYNAFPEHIDGPLEDENNVTRPEVRHAEKNALMGLVRSSESAVGSTLFVTDSCCFYCAIDLVDAGVKKVYYEREYRLEHGLEYLIKNGVEVIKYEGRN